MTVDVQWHVAMGFEVAHSNDMSLVSGMLQRIDTFLMTFRWRLPNGLSVAFPK